MRNSLRKTRLSAHALQSLLGRPEFFCQRQRQLVFEGCVLFVAQLFISVPEKKVNFESRGLLNFGGGSQIGLQQPRRFCQVFLRTDENFRCIH